MENATADANNIQEILKDYGFDIGYGAFIGWVIGFTLKKFFKLFAFVLGVYLLTLFWLQHTGFITIHWDVFQNWYQHGQESFKHLVESLKNSVPFSASFAVGFAIGFKMG